MKYIEDRAAKPKELFSIGQLFLRWRYNTARHIVNAFYIACTSSAEEQPLRIFELKDIYYQDKPVKPDNYHGFLLKLEALAYLGGYSHAEMLPKCSSLFVLKQDVQQVERLAPEVLALPAGDIAKLREKICTEKNLHKRIPQIFAELFTGNGAEFLPVEQEIPKRHVWPWLGSVITELPRRKEPKDKETIDSKGHLIEITMFVKAARDLGQNDPYCLAKMIRVKYPKATNKELVDIIEPERERTKNAKDQQVHRWLTVF